MGNCTSVKEINEESDKSYYTTESYSFRKIKSKKSIHTNEFHKNKKFDINHTILYNMTYSTKTEK
jgi:hypothetical protein